MDSGMLEPTALSPVAVQAAVFEAVASGRMLAGPIHDLAQQFEVTPITFTDCLGDLVDAGWVSVTTSPESVVTIQLDRDDRARAKPPRCKRGGGHGQHIGFARDLPRDNDRCRDYPCLEHITAELIKTGYPA